MRFLRNKKNPIICHPSKFDTVTLMPSWSAKYRMPDTCCYHGDLDGRRGPGCSELLDGLPRNCRGDLEGSRGPGSLSRTDIIRATPDICEELSCSLRPRTFRQPQSANPSACSPARENPERKLDDLENLEKLIRQRVWRAIHQNEENAGRPRSRSACARSTRRATAHATVCRFDDSVVVVRMQSEDSTVKPIRNSGTMLRPTTKRLKLLASPIVELS